MEVLERKRGVIEKGEEAQGRSTGKNKNELKREVAEERRREAAGGGGGGEEQTSEGHMQGGSRA